MDRATIKVKPETAARLRATMPELSAAADRMLTIDQALNYLLDSWDAVAHGRSLARWGRALSTGEANGGTH